MMILNKRWKDEKLNILCAAERNPTDDDDNTDDDAKN